ncbi:MULTISPECIES: hypothetical protein [Providencia]|uniref:Conjugal transfer protein TraV n=1 Tax=Providencia vermicola TaxID=333965 RepID=A0AAX3RTI8_9GAMM|nr:MULTISPECIES: hypothetical protein [Providencia]USB36465.1 hypothetical protein M5J11_16935 [Providencia vermicola]WFC05396.1 hypothetical protein PG365_11690 [Providencia vermicola]
MKKIILLLTFFVSTASLADCHLKKPLGIKCWIKKLESPAVVTHKKRLKIKQPSNQANR